MTSPGTRAQGDRAWRPLTLAVGPGCALWLPLQRLRLQTSDTSPSKPRAVRRNVSKLCSHSKRSTTVSYYRTLRCSPCPRGNTDTAGRCKAEGEGIQKEDADAVTTKAAARSACRFGCTLCAEKKVHAPWIPEPKPSTELAEGRAKIPTKPTCALHALRPMALRTPRYVLHSRGGRASFSS